MKLYVIKFGGSSVATIARIRHAAEIVLKHVLNGSKVVVVTSAMQGVTNQLIDLTKGFQESSIDREYDSVISSGEQVSSGLLAMCLCALGVSAKSRQGWQIPIKTTGVFSNAYIKSIDKKVLMDDVMAGVIPVVAGFQGISEDGDITTIGRGGSDATACALAYALNADECLIYTDVDGVYTADPRIVLKSQRLKEISYDEMLTLASSGARVLQSRSVVIAKQCNVKLRVLSSFSESGETIVTNDTIYIPKDKKITGIAHNANMSKADVYGENLNIAELLNSIYKNKASIDLISGMEFDSERLSFLFPKAMISVVRQILDSVEGASYEIDNDIGVVTIVGSAIKTDQSILPDIISTLSKNHIKMKQISVSELSVSIVVPFLQLEFIVNELHELFFGDCLA